MWRLIDSILPGEDLQHWNMQGDKLNPRCSNSLECGLMDHILILCLYFWRKEKNIYSSDRAYLALLHSRLTPSMAAVLKKAHKETLIFRQFETGDSLFAASHWGSQNHLCSVAPQEGIQVFTASLSHGMEVHGDARISAFLQHQGPGPLYPHCSIL